MNGTNGTLYMVRHGLALNNVMAVHSGHLDGFPLLEDGLPAVVRAADFLSGRGITKIWTSPIQRAMGTAGVIGGRCGVTPVIDTRLTEIDTGVYAGMSFDDVRAVRGDTAKAFWRGTMDARGGMETRQMMEERVLGAVHEMLSTGLNCVAVTHSWPIKVVINSIDRPSARKMLGMHTHNACVVAVTRGWNGLRWRMVLENEARRRPYR